MLLKIKDLSVSNLLQEQVLQQDAEVLERHVRGVLLSQLASPRHDPRSLCHADQHTGPAARPASPRHVRKDTTGQSLAKANGTSSKQWWEPGVQPQPEARRSRGPPGPGR